MVYEGDEGGVHALGVAAGEVGVCVAGVGLDFCVGKLDGFGGEVVDARAGYGEDIDLPLGVEEAVVGIFIYIQLIIFSL